MLRSQNGDSQALEQAIVYATALIINAIFFMLVKVVGWQWMSKYSVMREIKRLEVQIAELAKERRPEA